MHTRRASPSAKHLHPSAFRRMLARLAYRFATEISPRLAWKAGYLWAYRGMRAVAAYKKRVERGDLFPPFLFLALTNACNLRCHGCWIEGRGPVEQLP
ncbi:MAG: hypothetical protein ABR915_25290, partial [Thermoguttaceae bacterium]